MVGKLLDIFRVYYNFVEVGKDKKTPAMRLGLAEGFVTVADNLLMAGAIQWGKERL
jgi:hypothetical protein